MIITDVIAQPVKSIAQSVEPTQSVYSLRLNPPDARSLGLREGQVVNALIENRADGNVLLLNKNLLIRLPNQVPNPGTLNIKIRMDSITNGVLSLIFGKKADSAEKPPSTVALRLARLLTRGVKFDSLQSLLNLNLFSSSVGEETKQLLSFALRDSWFKAFNYKDIDLSLRASGLFHEQSVRDSRSQPNLKSVLLRLLRSVRLERPELFSIASAIEDLESSQIESLAQQLNRNTQYQWLIPVLGDWPIEIQLTEGDSQDDQEDNADSGYAWKVLIKIKLNEDETIDLSAVFNSSEVLSLYVVMPNQGLLEMANTRKNWLSDELEKQGIRVDELKIFRKEDTSLNDRYSKETQIEVEKRLIADA